MIAGVAQVGLRSRDIGRSVEFYRDRLRIRLLFQAPNMAFFDCGGVRLMIGAPESASGVYFRVEEIQSATAELKSRGVEFERDPHLVAKMPDHELWMAFFHDPDGNVLALMSEVRA